MAGSARLSIRETFLESCNASTDKQTGPIRSNGRWWVPDRTDRQELIDSFDQPQDDFRDTFRDLRRINRLFGGTSVVLQRISELMGSCPSASVLDVGTGSADIPRAMIRWAKARGKTLRIVAADSNPKALQVATTGGEPDLSFVLCDARRLPFRDDSFDYVLSSLTFHHFDDSTAAVALGEMLRVARRGIIVNDVRRAYLPALLIWLLTRILGMNRLTRHDAPLSVMRARTLDEYRQLARISGLLDARVYRHPFWRAAIVAGKAV